MDEDIKNLLEKNLEISQRSLEILQKMRRETMWSRLFKLVKWIIVTVLIIYGVITIQPYLAHWSGIISGISENIEKMNNIFR